MRRPGRPGAASTVDPGPVDAGPVDAGPVDAAAGAGGSAGSGAPAGVADGDGAPPGAAPAVTVKRPLYPRLLRLRHVRPNAWQRAALGEGAIALAVVLVLADVASAWTLLALPVAVAVIVKAHDLLAGLLARTPRADVEPDGPVEAEPSASTEPVERAEPSGPRD